MKSISFLLSVVMLSILISCNDENDSIATPPEEETNVQWTRDPISPIFRDEIPSENYQIASDCHVFFDDEGTLRMLYTGDTNGVSSIKLATGTSWNNWSSTSSLLSGTSSGNLDISKETSFYRKASNGKHQIYYIGYDDEKTFKAQIYLAEAAELTGPYTQMDTPIISRGTIAEKNVYLMTSPSVVEHEGLLYITFIGWDAAPNDVTAIWILGATSNDDGHTWSNFQEISTPIGTEGQVTKKPDGTFVSVRTAMYQGTEGIYYSTANHPFGPWTEREAPILIQAGAPLETDEAIAPQITIDPATNKEYLYYTGADYLVGYWIMLAYEE